MNMNKKFSFRKISKNDYNLFVFIFKEYQSSLKNDYFNDKLIERYFQTFTKPNQNRKTFWILYDNKMIGFISITFKNNLNNDVNIAHISEFFIKEKFQKQKFGTRVIEYFITLFKNKMNLLEITLDVDIRNKIALKFWKKMGFVERQIKMNKKLD